MITTTCVFFIVDVYKIFSLRKKLFNDLDLKFYLDGVQTRLPGRVLRALDESVLAAHDHGGGAEGFTVLETGK